ncbi:MAG TPA: fluoride efflux transporter CrcB [Opitutaceae bacterium]|nr:fluoride efflux transporter CrcB [Opitutaceae bacterium]
MSAASLVFIALGGAIGSVARALAGGWIPAGRLPWGTILVNIAGSLLIGWLMAKFPLTPENVRVHSFAVIGVCGGFTTFSSFSWQTIEQMQKGQWSLAAANIFLSVTLCLLATWIGWRVAR